MIWILELMYLLNFLKEEIMFESSDIDDSFKLKLCWPIYSWCCCLCCCSVTQSCPTLCDPMDCSTPGLPVLHYLLELAQTCVLWVSDAIQPSHPLSLPSPPALNLFMHKGLFQWVSSLHQVAKILELQLQLQHLSFQWIFRIDFLWGWLVWSPYSPRDSLESSPAPQFESINTLVLIYGLNNLMKFT